MLKTSENSNSILSFSDQGFKTAVSQMSEELRFPHAVLITGEGDALSAAEYFAAAALCTGEKRPCGRCASCRKAHERIHPDIITLSIGENTAYKAEDIRRIKSDASVLPNESEGKVYIITDAGKMNLYAANSLLKVLEEPPRGVHFVLLASDEKNIIGTVLSRTVRFRLAPKQSEEAGAEAAALLKTFLSWDSYEALKSISAVSYKKNELLAFLDSVGLIFKNALVKRMTGEAVSEEEKVIDLSDDKILSILEEIESLKDYASRNVSPSSVLMKLYLKVRR